MFYEPIFTYQVVSPFSLGITSVNLQCMPSVALDFDTMETYKQNANDAGQTILPYRLNNVLLSSDPSKN